MPRDGRPIVTPPIALVDDAKVAAAIEEYHRLKAAGSAEYDKLRELEDGRHEAVDEDRAALASALRAGTDDPGDKATAKADAEILACRRRYEALVVAADQAADEVVSAVDRQRDAWSTKLARREAKARAEFAAAVESLAKTRDALAEAVALQDWLVHFPHRVMWRYGSFFARVPALHGRNGEPLLFSAVVDGLQEMSEPPKPKSEPAEAVTPLRAVAG